MTSNDVSPVVSRIELTAELVCAYVANNPLPVAELLGLIAGVHAALTGLGEGGATRGEAPHEKPTPAQIRKSLTHAALISFIDGRPYKALKRHLGTHGLTIEAYRARYGLPANYPSVAPGYSATRSALARSLGLGRKAAEA